MPDSPHPSLRWRCAQWLEQRWWQRYLNGKDPVGYLSRKREYWQRLLRQLDMFPARPREAVLDAGCGPAGVFIALHRSHAVTALDPLLDKYDRLAIFDRTDYPTVCFVRQTLEATELRQIFSTIYCCNAINHVSDWEDSLDALTRLAAPGCQLLLTSDVHRHRWLLPLFRLLPGDALHPQQHLAEDYRAALTRRGWRIERETVLRRRSIFNYHAWVCRLC